MGLAPRTARAPTAVLLGLLLALTSCQYAKHRGLDATDIVDVKYGVALGLGAKAEATVYMGAGGGIGVLGYTREWFGRRSYVAPGSGFVHLLVVGGDGGHPGKPWTGRLEEHILLANATAFGNHGFIEDIQVESLEPDSEQIQAPPMVTRWRFGGEVLLPGFGFGLYLNVGELVDFLLGLGTLDIAADDGVSKAATYYIPPEKVDRDEKGSVEAPTAR